MILITGANGFIGSALAWALNKRGRADLVLCDHTPDIFRRKNLQNLRYKHFVDVADLFTKLKNESWGKKIEAVLHMGACADTTQMDRNFLRENNVNFSQRLCEWALARGARFIYASSAAVYGDGALGFSDDDDLTPRLLPLNPYGESKWLFDCWVLEKGLASKGVGLRFFNVFGPNEYHKGAMASVLFRSFPLARDEGRVRLFKSYKPDCADGEQKRDFIYIKDAVRVIEFFLAQPEANGIFNIGTGAASSFNQLGRALLAALGKNPRLEYFEMPEPLRPKYQYFTQADIGRLRGAGYQENFTPFDDAVADYVKNYLVPSKSLA